MKVSERVLVALTVLLAASPLGAAAPARPAAESVDLTVLSRIRQEALERSQAWDTAAHLTDVIGARLTGTPRARLANEWTRDRLTSWGLKNARLEPWTGFGNGWTYTNAWLRMSAPEAVSIPALPKAYTPGTKGPVKGRALRVELDTPEKREAQKGKLAGTILLLQPAKELPAPSERPVHRLRPDELEELRKVESKPARDRRAEIAKRIGAMRGLRDYLPAEGVLATVEPSEREGGGIGAGRGGSRVAGESVGVPALTVAPEHYNRLARLAEAGQPVELELAVDATFLPDAETFNTIAEIPGTDLADELVVIGAHLDSWHGGTGAQDNAAGVTAVMEAARVIQALGLKPRRTIRVALWTGEEQGLFGSVAYVADRIATFPPPDESEKNMPSFLRKPKPPQALKPEHARTSVYFNLDNGGGKIRGIYAEGNLAAARIFESWLGPLADLGASTVTLRGTTNTDHEPFLQAGLPAFQFIQDEMDYDTRAHHSNIDVLDRLRREDLAQMSAVLAAFAWQAANRDEKIPRLPLTLTPPAK
jgi:carboxypeptidase Q